MTLGLDHMHIISVGMVKQPTEHGGSEFLMSSEDFPALPGAPGNR